MSASPVNDQTNTRLTKNVQRMRVIDTPFELAYPELTHQLGDEPPAGYPPPSRAFAVMIHKQALMRRWNCSSDVFRALERAAVLIPKIKLPRVCLYSFHEVYKLEREGWKNVDELPPAEAFPLNCD